ncbi:hypothetical protein DRW48_11935 [Paracoccus suum]|uniref:Uncharacterized protein n=1 Tax=Paracoccus suum TaxID=2259340 RepID=A0A344PLQ5_9RHOB|nr:hypothetical protein [Paracoccus suum]AXC50310.1 hypothetical protein DRW48_11935 [Paracoccus suum]
MQIQFGLALLALLASGWAVAAQDAAKAPVDTAPNGAVAQAEAPDADDTDADSGEAPAAAASVAGPGHHDYGPSGIMSRANREDLAPLTLASGKPVAGAPYRLKSGGYYRIEVSADGSAELALSGGDFFRAIWVNEVVINDIEIRPMGLHSLEFDDAGTATISFVAIRPGSYALSVPGSSGEGQKATFVIE